MTADAWLWVALYVAVVVAAICLVHLHEQAAHDVEPRRDLNTNHSPTHFHNGGNA